MARTEIRDNAHWHELRNACAGNASDVPSIMGVADAYETPFTHFQKKRGTIPPEDFSENERVMIGTYFEPAIAAFAADKFKCTLVKNRAHYTDDAIGGILGATPDYWKDHEDSDTVVEIKNVSWGSFKDEWIPYPDGGYEPPLRFLLQMQAQLACTGAQHAILFACESGNRVIEFKQDRHEPAIAQIRAAVKDFKHALDNNIEPPAQMPEDYYAAKYAWTGGDGKVDMRGDTQLESWIASVAELRNTAKVIDADIKRIQGEVLAYCTNNKLTAINCNAGKISCKWREATPAHDRHFKAQPAHQELRITTAWP